MDALNDKIANLRHGINVFNTTTKLEGFDFTVDESLVRMAMLTEKKNRLSRMKGVRELVRNSVTVLNPSSLSATMMQRWSKPSTARLLMNSFVFKWLSIKRICPSSSM